METATGSMSEVVSALTTGITAETIFAVLADIMPFVIALVPIAMGMYFLRKLIKGSAKAKVRF